jgi:hypothetical protein
VNGRAADESLALPAAHKAKSRRPRLLLCENAARPRSWSACLPRRPYLHTYVRKDRFLSALGRVLAPRRVGNDARGASANGHSGNGAHFEADNVNNLTPKWIFIFLIDRTLLYRLDDQYAEAIKIR